MNKKVFLVIGIIILIIAVVVIIIIAIAGFNKNILKLLCLVKNQKIINKMM